MSTPQQPVPIQETDIAVIGMAARFPGAPNVAAFWQNLRTGVDARTVFSDAELQTAGVDPELLRNPNYVKANYALADVELFAGAFFGFSPREAEILDPQQRLFLECAWESLEDAGYDPDRYGGAIGVYAGAGMNTYLLNNLLPNRDLLNTAGAFQLMIANDKDYLATRAAYKLNLRGPSITVQSACSTSLVAIHLAGQSLLNGECDLVLAGGVTVTVPQQSGYLYQEGMIRSPDGYCRAFDARARGTVGGSGVGVVVLKRLAEALADGDMIYAVIKGSAINNDGARKAGYTAPSGDSQRAVIAEALAVAGTPADTLTYIEAHGTATVLGDPIEIAALSEAFRTHTQERGFCALGSVKTNIGHLDAAAGVAGFIKTVWALKNKQIPPSLHFEQANPEIDFENSPFYVNTKLMEWRAAGGPRRAGVSSFGIGGTNAHVVLQEAPPALPTGDSRPWHVLPLSARSANALEAATSNLVAHLAQHPKSDLAEVAYTFALGRKRFDYRRTLVCHATAEAAEALTARDPQRVFTQHQTTQDRSVVFMFPGQGAQYVNMGRELYRSEPVFRKHLDACAEILRPHLDIPLLEILYPQSPTLRLGSGQVSNLKHPIPNPQLPISNLQPVLSAAELPPIFNTQYTQPALFAIEYALAQLWLAWGVHPQALIGHSIGEYVAACLAGVFSFPDALALVAARGRLMQALPAGAMLAVGLSEAETQQYLSEEISLAAINGPRSCVLAGRMPAVAALNKQLAERDVAYIQLHTSHAFHSALMDPILAEFQEQVAQVDLQPPQIPYLSNVSGDWITASQVTDPDYWAQHLRQTVRFSAGLDVLLAAPESILLEVGPGRTLASLAQRSAAPSVLTSLPHPAAHKQAPEDDLPFLLATLGKLWLAGATVDWGGFYAGQRRRRISLPTYPFERRRYWIDPPVATEDATQQPGTNVRRDQDDWFYQPAWQSAPLLDTAAQDSPGGLVWLLFVDECDIGAQLMHSLEQAGQIVITAARGPAFAQTGARIYTLNPAQRDDYDQLFEALLATDGLPQRIVHMWNITPDGQPPADWGAAAQENAFYSLMFLAQALGKQDFTADIHLSVVSNNLQHVAGETKICAEKAALLGPVQVIPLEYPHVRCRSFDILLPANEREAQLLNAQMMRELASEPTVPIVALRDRRRWMPSYRQLPLPPAECPTVLREQGVYLITGGLGGLGLSLAEYLARTVAARLILIGRTKFPQREDWPRLIAHAEQDVTIQKIQTLQRLESLGAEVWVGRADVTNLDEMQALRAAAQDRFGPVHGVIHAAGAPGGGMLQRKTRDMAAEVLASKITGALVLAELFQDAELDFMVFLSSLTAISAEFGQADYCAANAFLDAFAQQRHKQGYPTISINWDTWREVGMAVNTVVPAELQDLRDEALRFGISAAEGWAAFARILESGLPQVVVSTRDLQVRRARPLQLAAATQPAHQRPDLGAPYVAPANQVEGMVASIWAALLGLEQVGTQDDFFELGGHSLLATQVISHLHAACGVTLPLAAFFERPTVAHIAEQVRARQQAQTDGAGLEQIMAEVAALSDKEVEQLLAEAGPYE